MLRIIANWDAFFVDNPQAVLKVWVTPKLSYVSNREPALKNIYFLQHYYFINIKFYRNTIDKRDIGEPVSAEATTSLLGRTVVLISVTTPPIGANEVE